MRLLLDTQVVIWWLTGSGRLPATTEELVREQAHAVYVSRASLWEMAIKLSIGKLRIDLPRFAKAIEASGFEWLDIRNEHLLAVATLPFFEDHRDPFDRLLVAQSRSEPLILLTADARLESYGATVRVLGR